MEAGPSGHALEHSDTEEAMEVDETREDLIGEPYAVVESDPGSFVVWRCGHQSHAYPRRLHVYHTTAWCIERRSEGGREH